MKKLILLSAVLIAGLTASAQAQIISVSTSTTYNASLQATNDAAGTATAGNGGDYDVTNWNTFQALGGDRNGGVTPADPAGGEPSPMTGGAGFGGANLQDSTGNTSTGLASTFGFSVAWSWADHSQQDSSGFSGAGNQILTDTGISPGSGALTLNMDGLATGQDYTVIAYMSDIYFSYPTSVNVTLGGQSASYIPNNSATTFVQGVNYVEFDDVTTTNGDLTLSATGVGGQPLLTGFQIVDTGAATPEPSSMALMALGMLGLSFLVRRSRDGSKAMKHLNHPQT